MTEKKELILETALKLFAEQGFDTTPTSKIARLAGVSEGLIFRHFGTKEGLMKAVVELGESRIGRHLTGIEQEGNHRQRIHKIIELAYVLFQEEREFWQLQFTIKWQRKYTHAHTSPHYLRLMQLGMESFRALGYAEPEKEIQLLAMLVEGFGSMMIKQPDAATLENMLTFIKSKY
ncbi:TetR/AcrR family transcriptional regulator [Arundinibacter roseus]|uniref:TetR/AcrR family transcriptional regulator n=1 Tax=Arundinibacter roseus TaxID=2070510 RepID=A0A4R4KD23_9BACT|nr:TetR/AcrR family transcriptional regulator [Arundinibacter roseus]TDB65784.1 TetR/AcrR family transcriptional regulator [Arundinibacter roseus]